MYIKSLTIENFRSFVGVHTFEFRDSLNYLVGDNNGGKSSVFEAVSFLAELFKQVKEEDVRTRGIKEPTRVEMVLSGDMTTVLDNEKFIKLQPYVFRDATNDQVLRVERSTAQREVVQNGKKSQLSVKSICFWNNEAGQFENPTGIDALFKGLIDFEMIWADTDPAEITDFGSTKTLGRLLDGAAKEFLTTQIWKDFSTAHAKAFSNDDNSLEAETVGLAEEIEALVQDQYGHAKARFGFTLPDAAAFMKMGDLLVDDGMGETPVRGKGTGMRRAFALAIIQLYAGKMASGGGAADALQKPLILLLDEPETWLHPNAQLKLVTALASLARTQQVFLITHSPYLLRKFESSEHQLVVFKGMGDQREVEYSHRMGVLGRGEPTWGEINFYAFGICSYEFHNELYGAIQRHVDSTVAGERPADEKDLDVFFVSKKISKTKTWRRKMKQYPASLPVYVRNFIHHPENALNDMPTDNELLLSTQHMLDVLEGLRDDEGNSSDDVAA